MLIIYFKRALRDIQNHKLLNIITVITIALSVLIIGSFFLFFGNVSSILGNWEKGIRMMVYINSDLSEEKRLKIKEKIVKIEGIREIRFISKNAALKHLKKQMKRHSSLFENLKENPLPDAFEIQTIWENQTIKNLEKIARKIEKISFVKDVEYGEKWFQRFNNLYSFFRFTGYSLSCLFFMAVIFIVANTIRLILYSRGEEIGIIRLVGATDNFIKIPFYLEGIIQGVLGGIIGLVILFIAFILISSSISQEFSAEALTIRFLSFSVATFIVIFTIIVGWLGSYLSLRHFFKS